MPELCVPEFRQAITTLSHNYATYKASAVAQQIPKKRRLKYVASFATLGTA